MIPTEIVLATDFSPASSAALSIAGRVAHIFKAKVLVVHVFQYVAHHQYQVPVGWMIECIRRDVQHRMNETRKVLADIGVVETEGRLIEDGFHRQRSSTSSRRARALFSFWEPMRWEVWTASSLAQRLKRSYGRHRVPSLQQGRTSFPKEELIPAFIKCSMPPTLATRL